MVRCEFFFKKKQGKKYHGDIFFAKKNSFLVRPQRSRRAPLQICPPHAGKDTNCGKLKECRSEEGGLARMRRGGNQGRETRFDEAGLPPNDRTKIVPSLPPSRKNWVPMEGKSNKNVLWESQGLCRSNLTLSSLEMIVVWVNKVRPVEDDIKHLMLGGESALLKIPSPSWLSSYCIIQYSFALSFFAPSSPFLAHSPGAILTF